MDELLEFLEKNYSEEKVAEMFDEETLNWVEEDWNEDYETEYDWYIDFRNGEAEDEVISNITNDIRKALPNLSPAIDIKDVLKEKYEILDYSM